MTILGLDPGTKRIGIAISDDHDQIATPLEVYARRTPEADLKYIGDLAEMNEVDALVVGLPLNMNGSEGPGAQSARAFAQQLSAATGLTVELFDERLTTFAAEDAMIQAGLSRAHRKKRVDKVAAQMILQGYLDARNPGLPRI